MAAQDNPDVVGDKCVGQADGCESFSLGDWRIVTKESNDASCACWPPQIPFPLPVKTGQIFKVINANCHGPDWIRGKVIWGHEAGKVGVVWTAHCRIPSQGEYDDSSTSMRKVAGL